MKWLHSFLYFLYIAFKSIKHTCASFSFENGAINENIFENIPTQTYLLMRIDVMSHLQVHDWFSKVQTGRVLIEYTF